MRGISKYLIMRICKNVAHLSRLYRSFTRKVAFVWQRFDTNWSILSSMLASLIDDLNAIQATFSPRYAVLKPRWTSAQRSTQSRTNRLAASPGGNPGPRTCAAPLSRWGAFESAFFAWAERRRLGLASAAGLAFA